jgi:hypothetical protein
VVAVVEAVVDTCPPGPDLLHLLLAQERRHPADWRWAEWLLPLAAAAACSAGAAPAPAESWRVLVRLAARVSRAAARALAERAVEAQPWDVGLWALLQEFDGGVTAGAQAWQPCFMHTPFVARFYKLLGLKVVCVRRAAVLLVPFAAPPLQPLPTPLSDNRAAACPPTAPAPLSALGPTPAHAKEGPARH